MNRNKYVLYALFLFNGVLFVVLVYSMIRYYFPRAQTYSEVVSSLENKKIFFPAELKSKIAERDSSYENYILVFESGKNEDKRDDWHMLIRECLHEDSRELLLIVVYPDGEIRSEFGNEDRAIFWVDENNEFRSGHNVGSEATIFLASDMEDIHWSYNFVLNPVSICQIL